MGHILIFLSLTQYFWHRSYTQIENVFNIMFDFLFRQIQVFVDYPSLVVYVKVQLLLTTYYILFSCHVNQFVFCSPSDYNWISTWADLHFPISYCHRLYPTINSVVWGVDFGNCHAYCDVFSIFQPKRLVASN